MSPLTRKPAFWIAYVVLAGVAVAVALRLFPVAIPLVNLDVRMSRTEALAAGEALNARLKFAPAEARSAVQFNHDGATQNYVELEAGGRAAFAELTRGGVYSPYWWDVRLFAPGVIEEAVVRFKPDGTPAGFVRRLAEAYVREPATKALDAAAARTLAETRAKADWAVDFASYTLHDQAQSTLPSGRVDHTFVYERPERLGEARIRLRLAVAGDELVGVAPFVFVPESFNRRFQELRSANNLIATVASASAGLLYGVLGCILGSLWLLRRHWLVWRPALVAGLVVAALLAVAQLANAPAAWYSADTVESPLTFWLKQGGAFLYILCGGAMGYTLAFMAAESLSRRAFPSHPQLWKLWSRDAGSTVEVAGRTAGGYLFVPIELALIAIFYYATNRWLGWWQPSEYLSDPNILSSAIPAASPIAISLQAGFMEECVFRAIPLALGALIGERFGRRGLGIAIAFVVQALIFGGAHANYPGLPAYSRPVELILPSMMWALIFLRFGLLPTILLHATFDLVLFSIPLFLIDAPGARSQQALVIAAALVPAAIVLWRRAQNGAWTTLAERLRNGGWLPTLPAAGAAATAEPGTAVADRHAIVFQKALPLLGIAGVAAWLAFTPFKPDAPTLSLSREDAIARADAALAARGVVPGAQWQRFAAIRLASDDASQWAWHKFIWQEKGADVYRKLIGTALPPPLWEVRYAMFDGDVADRAEEWRATIASDGSLRTLRHVLPQGRAGARPARDAALALAQREVRARFGVDPATLREAAADEERRQDRTDWSFMFTDPAVDVGPGAELRYVVTLGGDEITGSGRVVHVPETWLRAEQERDKWRQVVRMSAGIAFMIAGFVAFVLGVIAWTRGRCDVRAARWVGGLAFAVAVASFANGWPVTAMQLDTAEPVFSQYAGVAIGALVGGLVGALLFGVVAGIGAWHARSAPRAAIAGVLPPWAAAIAAALLVAGVQAVITNFGSRQVPLWPPQSGGSTWSPALAAFLGGIGFVNSAGIGLFVLCIVARLTRNWTRYAALGVGLVVLLQCASALSQGGPQLIGALAAGIAGGAVVAAVLWLLLRYDARLVPMYLATGSVLGTLGRAVQDGTPTAYGVAAVSVITTMAVAWLCMRYVGTPLPPAAVAAEPLPAAPPAPPPATASSPSTA